MLKLIQWYVFGDMFSFFIGISGRIQKDLTRIKLTPLDRMKWTSTKLYESIFKEKMANIETSNIHSCANNKYISIWLLIFATLFFYLRYSIQAA